MDVLKSVIQPYAWGSRTAIAQLQGRPSPTESPEAELWMGAHPAAPSRVGGQSLPELIDADAERLLGAQTVARFGPRLPFLLKVLAAETPLSLQAHPSLEQARQGFERENQAGVPLSSPARNYKDDNHKPELICALGPFDALCGFRDPAQSVLLLESLDVPGLSPLIAHLRAGQAGLRDAFAALMTLPAAEREQLVPAVAEACGRGGPFAQEKGWAQRLAALYPNDAGVVGALLLNLVRVNPGDAIYLPAGNLHAYLQGTGVEIMASSDNVLRGGCTPKHVDVPELLRVLDFRSGPVDILRAVPVSAWESVYRTPAPEFQLSRIALAGEPVRLAVSGPEILLSVEGAVRGRGQQGEVQLPRGTAAFIPASDREVELTGAGTLFRARVAPAGR